MSKVNPVIKAIRTERGLSGRIAEQLGITREAVWQWEKVPPKHAVRVANFMELPIEVVCPELYQPLKRRNNHRANR